MGRNRTVSRCGACGATQPRWLGRCPACGAWGTMSEEAPPASCHAPAPPTAQPLAEVPIEVVARLGSGIGELDRVLGGGIVPGSVVLLGGEPGVGKSTLALQACRRVAAGGRTVLYVSGEESAGQVRLRAERLGALPSDLLVAAETSLEAVLALVERHSPDLLVVDSLQTLTHAAVTSEAGSTASVRACAPPLVQMAKSRRVATLLIGHVTKDGALAGPRALEHLVDVVVLFEGDRHHALRLLRAVKNRYGPAGEVGCFEMAGAGLREVADPSRLFLADHDAPVAGVAVTVALEGPRPLAVEMQALVAPTTLAAPRRQASGLDHTRLCVLVAVLERRAGVVVSNHDLFASVVGGVRVREPAADLALCLAVASSRRDRALPRGVVAVGEVGLAGEIRAVSQCSRRLAEAARLGFAAALVPASYRGSHHGLRLRQVRDLRDALDAAVPAVKLAPRPA